MHPPRHTSHTHTHTQRNGQTSHSYIPIANRPNRYDKRTNISRVESELRHYIKSQSHLVYDPSLPNRSPNVRESRKTSELACQKDKFKGPSDETNFVAKMTTIRDKLSSLRFCFVTRLLFPSPRALSRKSAKTTPPLRSLRARTKAVPRLIGPRASVRVR